MLYIFFQIIFAFLVSHFLYKKFIFKFSNNFLDIPNDRSIHKYPIPRGAGIIFVIISCLSSLFYLVIYGASKEIIIPFLILPLAIVGLIDDLYSLKPTIKYFFQFLTGIFIYQFTDLFITIKYSSIYGFIILISVVIFFTSIINFVNFMDGIDGLVSSCMAISIFTTSIILGLSGSHFFLIGSIISFIYFNWHPAKIFMGDTGSTFLAAINISLICLSSNFREALNLLLILSPLIIDPIVCIIRRYLHGENIFLAHKLHLYQRLSLSGLSQDKISLIYLSSTVSLSISNFFYDLKVTLFLILIILLIGIYLDKYIAKSFLNVLKSSQS